MGMTVASAVAATLGVGDLVVVTTGATVTEFGASVGGTCAPDTGRARATFTSDDRAGRCADSIGPVRVHITIAANTIGIANITPTRSLKRIESFLD